MDSERRERVFICILLKPRSSDPKEAEKEFEANWKRSFAIMRWAALTGCDWIWVFPSEDCPMISKEMRGEIEHAEKHGIKKYFWTQHKAGEIERWLHYYDLIMNFDKKVTK
ncbi:MAG: hypothetical protein HYW88_02480 [Candidatus Sungbacteria bacterium]|nr:hypothetical protein [Candidatus Sungbacteria bacterium]